MNSQLTTLLQFVFSYVLVIGIAYALVNFLTNGFINKFIAVKASRGKKVLVEVHAVGDIYYRTGVINEALLVYKDRLKQKKSILVDRGSIFYKSGLKCVFVDDVKNAVLKPDFTAVPGFDAVKFDNLLVRALTNPILQNNLLIIVIILLVVAILLLFGNLALAYSTKKAVAYNLQYMRYVFNSTIQVI